MPPSESFKRDSMYAANSILQRNMDIIVLRLSEGYYYEQIIDDVIKKENINDCFDLAKIIEIIEGSGSDSFVLLSGFINDGGMPYEDIKTSLSRHAIKIVTEQIRLILLNVAEHINEKDIECIERILNYKVENKLPFKFFKEKEKTVKPTMLQSWIELVDKLYPKKENVFIGSIIRELCRVPLDNYISKDDFGSLIKVDRDLATFYPDLYGVIYENVKFAYQLLTEFNNIEEAPKDIRVNAASKRLALYDLVDDEDAEVRIEVAKQGYGLDLLTGDENELVKLAAKNYLKINNLLLIQWIDANPDKWGASKFA